MYIGNIRVVKKLLEEEINLDITIIDLVVLEKINEIPVSVVNPNFKVTDRNMKIYYQLTSGDIKSEEIVSTVNKLKQNGLVETSCFEEELKYFSNAELKKMLSSMGLRISGAKLELVDRIIDFNNNHENQIVSNHKKTFYKVTQKGLNTLDKHHNVTWINKNFLKVFGHRSEYGISERDFIKSPDIDMKAYLINRFKDDSYVLSNTYFIFGEYENSFFSLIDCFISDMDNFLDKKKKNPYAEFDGFYAQFRYNYSEKLNYININEEKVEERLIDLFNRFPHIKRILSKDNYLVLVFPIIRGETKNFSEISKILNQSYYKKTDSITNTNEDANKEISNLEKRDVEFLYSRLGKLNLEIAEIIEELKRLH